MTIESMTIEEAIAHAREVAENKRETVKIADETYPNTDLSENETYNRCKKMCRRRGIR